MKTQEISGSHHLPCKQDEPNSVTKSSSRLLTIVFVLFALLAGSTASFGQSPPSTYDALSDGWGFPGDPATMANSQVPTSGWSFTATLPSAYQYQSREVGCQVCLNEFYWSYDYHSGGAFTLTDGTDTFNGVFTSGYGAGYSEDGGPDVERLALSLYFTGQWDGNGPKQSGFMQLVEGGEYPFVDGTATLSFAPAPEPGSVLLFGSGIVALAGTLRRKLLK